MKTNEKKMIRNSMMVVLAVLVAMACGPQAVVTSARGDSITFGSIAAAPNTPANTIATADFTDWALGNGNHMAGGSRISVLSTSTFSDASYPTFTYSNGTSPVSATGETGTFCWDGGTAQYGTNNNSRIAIHVAAGSTGTVTLWAGGWTWADLEGSFSPTGVFTSGNAQSNPTAWTYLTLVGGGADSVGGAANHKVVFTYNSATAQDLDILLNGRGDLEPSNAGFFAVGVKEVPEPGTLVLVITGLIGLLAYAWRKLR